VIAATPVHASSEAGVTGRVRVAPIVVALELSAGSIRVGEQVTARATVSNVATETVRSILVTVRYEPVGLSGRGPSSVRLSQLKPGRSGDVSVRLCATQPGAYLVLAQATVVDLTIESRARLVTVTAGKKAHC
jgi:hypothetical protein